MTELAGELAKELRRLGFKLATVESCTGGLLGAAITDVPGASAVYLGGWVTYADELKTLEVGVPRELLERHGAVSAEAAEAMAAGGLKRSNADWCVSITGIAGPDGGTAEKPVGTVWVGLAGKAGAASQPLKLSGSRQEIRAAATEAAIAWMLKELGAIRR